MDSATNASFIFSYTNSAKLRLHEVKENDARVNVGFGIHFYNS